MDDAPHRSFYWRPESLPLSCLQAGIQPPASLANGHPFSGPSPDSRPAVGGQTVFPSLVYHRANAAPEAAHRQRDRGRRQHDAAGIGLRPDALAPEVVAGEGTAPVGLHIPHTTGKVQRSAVADQRSL